MSAVCTVLDVARSTIAECMAGRSHRRLGRPPQPDDDLLAAIKAVIGDLPTYGYRRVHAILCRKAQAAGTPLPNHERVHRVMKAHGRLLQRHPGDPDTRRHDGRIAVDHSNLRWCSDGFEIGCDNGEKRITNCIRCDDRQYFVFSERRSNAWFSHHLGEDRRNRRGHVCLAVRIFRLRSERNGNVEVR